MVLTTPNRPYTYPGCSSIKWWMISESQPPTTMSKMMNEDEAEAEDEEVQVRGRRQDE